MKSKEAIPTHKIQKITSRPFFVVQYTSEDIKEKHWAQEKHRDDFFMFLILKKGSLELEADFKHIVMTAPSVFYIKPGQVHIIQKMKNIAGWSFAVEPSFLHKSYSQLLEDKILSPTPIHGKEYSDRFDLLENLLPFLAEDSLLSSTHLRKDIVNSMVGIIVGCFQTVAVQATEQLPTRWLELYRVFRQMVGQSYRTIKRPSDYADSMYISLSYLNEVVKSVSGFPVSYWINYEVVLEAKRLLYYTELPIKEIAFSLGYEDPAYFSRLFSNNADISPNMFRNKNRE